MTADKIERLRLSDAKLNALVEDIISVSCQLYEEAGRSVGGYVSTNLGYSVESYTRVRGEVEEPMTHQHGGFLANKRVETDAVRSRVAHPGRSDGHIVHQESRGTRCSRKQSFLGNTSKVLAP